MAGNERRGEDVIEATVAVGRRTREREKNELAENGTKDESDENP